MIKERDRVFYDYVTTLCKNFIHIPPENVNVCHYQKVVIVFNLDIDTIFGIVVLLYHNAHEEILTF